MKNLKQCTSLWENTNCEGTDLTDEQRSKLSSTNDRYIMASGSLADSIWASRNAEDLDKLKTCTITPGFGDRAKGDSSKLSSPAAHVKSGGAIKTATVSPIQSSSMAADIDNQLNTSPWSVQQSQTYCVTPNRIATTVGSCQELAHGNDNTSYVPPHLRGINHNRQGNLPPHLRAVAQNSQYNVSSRSNQSTEFNNISPGSSTLQTPHQSKAPTAAPVWHVSPESQAKQSVDSDMSAASMESNKSSPSTKGAIISRERTIRPSSTPGGSQEEDFVAFPYKRSKESPRKFDMAETIQQVSTDPAPQPALQSVCPVTTQTDHVELAVHRNRYPPSSVENTDNFLAFLLKKEKNSRMNGKRYVAVDTSIQPKITEADVKHGGQYSVIVQNNRKEDISIYPVPKNVTCVSNGLKAAEHGPMAVQGNIPAAATSNLLHGREFSVPLTGHEAVTPATVDEDLDQDDTSSRDARAVQNSLSSNNVTGQSSHGWEDSRLLNAKEIQKALLSEMMACSPLDHDAPRLTAETLIERSCWAPRVRSEDSFCDRVSDTGVEMKKENVRALQGRSAADELLNRDSEWYPCPLDWEYSRYDLDLSFMPKYIREDWLPFVPHGRAVTVDTSTEGFRQGKLPVNDRVLGKEVIQPDCIPDIANSENNTKRLRQTAELDAIVLTKKHKKRTRHFEVLAAESEARHREIAALQLAPHPYAPAIPIYLRPAILTDATGIKAIYNYYVKNSIIPEDQAAIVEGDVAEIIKLCQQEKLPCVVAIKGNIPNIQPQGHCGKSSKPLFPQFETIVGFGFAQTYGYGINGLRSGRSRTTAELQFYVHHEYTRKGIGRSLLDRLIQSLSHSYAAKDGYDWINPRNDPIYDGTRLWHQLVIQLPVEVKDDTTLPWFSEFLLKYWFEQEARLKRLARSSVFGSDAKFLDVVVFAKTASVEMEHPPFL